ncbi:flavodoxin domain-containing protein [Brachyspira sp. G79]|uniref:flavodoxin domain-containing protein n=1 Tax=Brachyspira sp. G79 TaxID=1358104 RepID=UPI000BBC3718|nr:flavodoxin domain-containing protein [Brachyspira sp. G79]PCG19186.1 flavodoxin [Brachyspira sp. G79]
MSKKIAIVVWSKTGNTRLMSKAIKEGAESVGASVEVFKSYNFGIEETESYDTIAFGCPAMGAETLEDTEFLPMYETIKPYLKNKNIFLFGSYGWGDGKWMRDWREDAINNGISLFREPIIAKETPSNDILDELKSVGRELASA